MHESAAEPQLGLTQPINPPAVSIREILPWGVFALVLGLLVYFVGVEQSGASVLGGNIVHEWVHDGRHLLGFPCH